MKRLLKEVFNVKTILGSYIGAVGYGVGYNLPNEFGCHPMLCLFFSLVLGRLFDTFSNTILDSKYFNKSRKNKIAVAAYIYVGYLLAWAIVDYTLDYDLDFDFLSNVVLIIAIQIILLIKNALIKTMDKKQSENK